MSLITLKQEREAMKHLQALRNMEFRVSPNAIPKVHTADGKVVLEVPSSTTNASQTVNIPFGISNVAPIASGVSITTPGTGYVGGGIDVGDVLTVVGGVVAPGGLPTQITAKQVGSTGQLLSAIVTQVGNYTTPPTYPASLTGGSGSGAEVWVLSAVDSWRTIQINSGWISARPAYEITSDGLSPYPVIDAANIPNTKPVGSPEIPVGIDCTGTLFGYDYFSVGTLLPVSANTPTVLYGYVDGIDIFYGQIVMDPSGTIYYEDGTVANPGQACFWIQITDDTTKGFYATLMGQMFTGSNPPIPAGPNIIPIGVVIASGGSTPTGELQIQQIQYGNATNRFATMQSVGYQMTRGWWSRDNLVNMQFYYGDLVVDDSYAIQDMNLNPSGPTPQIDTSWSPEGTLVQFFGAYQYKLPYGTETEPPGALPSTTGPHNRNATWTLVEVLMLPLYGLPSAAL